MVPVSCPFSRLLGCAECDAVNANLPQKEETMNTISRLTLTKSILVCVATTMTLTAQTYTNTAVGDEALLMNTTGTLNTAAGYQSLKANTTGVQNTADGAQS